MTQGKIWATIAFTVFLIYMNIECQYIRLLSIALVLLVVYSRPIPTKMSRCCTSSFPVVPFYNCGLFLQRNPNHKSDSTMLVKVCSKNLAWKNGPFKYLSFFFACFSNQFLNTTRKCFEICGVQIQTQHFFRLKAKQKKQTGIHHKPSVPLAWVLKFVKSLIYFKTII